MPDRCSIDNTLPFEFNWRHVADWFEQATIVEPVNPFERRVLHGVQRAPGTTIAAALAALHPDKATIERVIEMTESSDGYQRENAALEGPGAYRRLQQI